MRTLCADLGKALGCGGHLKTLKRTGSSGFQLKDALPLSKIEQLADSGDIAPRVLPMVDALGSMRSAAADDSLAAKVAHGVPLTSGDIVPEEPGGPGSYIKIVSRGHDLLAVVQQKKDSKTYDYCCVFQT